jgi:peptide/nickel transport system permease protein
MIDHEIQAPAALPSTRKGPTRVGRGFRVLLGRPSRTIGIALIALAAIAAVFAPVVAPYDPFALAGTPFDHPSSQFLLGTDNLGRDVLSRVIWGTRTSLPFAVGAAGISLICGLTFGSLAGYYGGAIDHLLSRIFEIFVMIPMLVLLIVVASLYGRHLSFTMIVIGLVIWPANAKIARAQVLTIKTRGYVTAARGAGASDWWLLTRRIIPNGISPVIANSVMQVAAALLIEASLAFLGLGDPNVVSWGQMIQDARPYLQIAWWSAVFPGMALALLVLAFHLIGEGFETEESHRSVF